MKMVHILFLKDSKGHFQTYCETLTHQTKQGHVSKGMTTKLEV